MISILKVYFIFSCICYAIGGISIIALYRQAIKANEILQSEELTGAIEKFEKMGNVNSQLQMLFLSFCPILNIYTLFMAIEAIGIAYGFSKLRKSETERK